MEHGCGRVIFRPSSLGTLTLRGISDPWWCAIGDADGFWNDSCAAWIECLSNETCREFSPLLGKTFSNCASMPKSSSVSVSIRCGP